MWKKHENREEKQVLKARPTVSKGYDAVDSAVPFSFYSGHGNFGGWSLYNFNIDIWRVALKFSLELDMLWRPPGCQFCKQEIYWTCVKFVKACGGRIITIRILRFLITVDTQEFHQVPHMGSTCPPPPFRWKKKKKKKISTPANLFFKTEVPRL